MFTSLKVNYKITFTLFITLMTNVSAKDDLFCVKDGTIRWHQDNKLTKERRSFCYNAKHLEIESPKFTFNDYKKIDFSKINTGQGSPGFKLCRDHYQGNPKIVQFQPPSSKNWIEVSICQFSDGKFIDIPRLMSRSH